jgi:hypothetical protein
LADILDLETDEFWEWLKAAQVVQTEINKQVPGK